MTEMLQATVDKFTFRVPTDRFYSLEGVWVLRLPAGADVRVRIGVTDYLQQRSGDVAFADTVPVGTGLKAGDEAGTIETIKATQQVASPIAGVVVATNPLLKSAPEVINQDPYGEGWLAEIVVANGEAGNAGLVDPATYLAHMKAQALAEVGSP